MKTFLLGLLLLSVGILAPVACHNVTPDQFFNAVVDCASTNAEASAALSSVETCLVGVVSQNAGICLSGLVTDAHFTIDEVACVVAYIAQQGTTKAATATATPRDISERNAAVDWLNREHISIVNSYPGPASAPLYRR